MGAGNRCDLALQETSMGILDEINEAMDKAADAAADAYDATSQAVSDGYDAAAEKARQAAEAAKRAADRARQEAEEVARKGEEAAREAARRAKDAADEAKRQVQQAAQDAKEKAEEIVDAAKKTAEAAIDEATEKAKDAAKAVGEAVDNAEKKIEEVFNDTPAGSARQSCGAPPEPEPVQGTPTPISPTANSIICSGGNLIVQNNNSGPDRGCTQAHEGSHIRDWKRRYGDDCCRGVPDGQLPLGGPGYEEFLRLSECTAYRVGKACREALLATAPAADKPAIRNAIERDNAQIAANRCT